jgi:hypothetical protein
MGEMDVTPKVTAVPGMDASEAAPESLQLLSAFRALAPPVSEPVPSGLSPGSWTTSD